MQKITFIKYTKTLLLFAAMFSFTACEDDDLVMYEDGGFTGIADPLLRINDPVVAFQAGVASYSYSIDFVNNANADIDSIRAYIIYTDVSQKKSNRILFETFAVTDDTKESFTDTFTYDDLRAGLSVDGAALPASDTELAVGSNWVIDFVGVTNDGELVPFQGKVTVGVLSRFAGLYRAIETTYYRIGVLSLDWAGETRFIGSVNENTFSHNDFWGPFAWTGNQFNFEINLSTNEITVPIILEDFGLFSGNRATNCEENSNELTNVPCGSGTNILIPDDVDGKHRIILTYGYFTDGSGPREFYEVLEKVVD